MGVVGGDVGDGPYCLKHVAEDVDDGQVHDGVEAAQPRVGRDAAEDGKEVDEHDEDVVYADGLVVRPAQVVAQVQQQDGCVYQIKLNFVENDDLVVKFEMKIKLYMHFWKSDDSSIKN